MANSLAPEASRFRQQSCPMIAALKLPTAIRVAVVRSRAAAAD